MRYDTGVCEKDTPFVRAVALQCSSRNCSPLPDLVYLKLMFTRVLLSRGGFVSQTPVFITVPLPEKFIQTSCCPHLFYKLVLRIVLGMGMGMNVTAQTSWLIACS